MKVRDNFDLEVRFLPRYIDRSCLLQELMIAKQSQNIDLDIQKNLEGTISIDDLQVLIIFPIKTLLSKVAD